MRFKQSALIAFGLLLSSSLFAQTSGTHFLEGKVDICRMTQGGDLMVYVVSNVDTTGPSCGSLQLAVRYSSTTISATTINRFLAMCLAAKAGNKNLRMDYLNCEGTVHVLSDSSSFQVRN